jgi:hypothetical protein
LLLFLGRPRVGDVREPIEPLGVSDKKVIWSCDEKNDSLVGDISIPFMFEARFVEATYENTITNPVVFYFMPSKLQRIDLL